MRSVLVAFFTVRWRCSTVADFQPSQSPMDSFIHLIIGCSWLLLFVTLNHRAEHWNLMKYCYLKMNRGPQQRVDVLKLSPERWNKAVCLSVCASVRPSALRDSTAMTNYSIEIKKTDANPHSWTPAEQSTLKPSPGNRCRCRYKHCHLSVNPYLVNNSSGDHFAFNSNNNDILHHKRS